MSEKELTPWQWLKSLTREPTDDPEFVAREDQLCAEAPLFNKQRGLNLKEQSIFPLRGLFKELREMRQNTL